MRANYNQSQLPAEKPFSAMTERELKAWNMTEPYRMQEYEAIANAIIISVLFHFATRDKDPHGAIRLRQDWEGMVRCRVEARRDLRVQDGRYNLAATGKNVEDYYMLEELRKKGADVLEWEKGVTMDALEGVHFAPWSKGGRK